MSHSLVELSFAKWPELLELYSEHRKCTSAYSLILNYINLMKMEPEIGAKIYTLDGDWKKDGTFILIDPEVRTLKVYFNTLSENLKRLRSALACLDTSRPYVFFAIKERYIPILRQYLMHAGYSEDDVFTIGTALYHIEGSKALEFSTESPMGISFAPLHIQHAEMVNSFWPHASNGFEKLVQRLIKSNDSVGAFDEYGNLVAWCLRYPVGSMAILHVLDTHKRQGLGSLVVRKMARIIALKNEEVLASVVFNNAPSQSMFEKLGFRIIDNVYWVLVPAK